jgi:sugar O-acyltransferase (sialic acid O-acetyltransferase NeuD family)
MKKQQILLIGGGSHCKSVIDVIEQENKFQIGGIIDLPQKVGELLLGYPIIGTDDDIFTLKKDFEAIHISMGKIDISEKRSGTFNSLKEAGFYFPVIISPLAYVSKHAFIGEGSILMHGVIVNAGAHIGRNCIINTKSLIEHDAVIGDHCHIATGAIINGGVEVGSESFIGSGAVSKQYSIVPFGSFIKANSIIK